MAFNPDRLSLFAQPIGEGGIRFFNYETDEDEDVILGTSYFEDAEERGLRPYDLIFVSPLSGTREPYILTVESIDADGDATVVDGSRVSTSIPRYRDRAAVGDAKIPTTVDNILIQAFDADVDPSVGRANYKAATDAEYTAMPALLRQTDANGRKFVINEKKFSLDMAGAPTDGTGDSADAFDAVFDLIKADINANYNSSTRAIQFTRYVIDLAGGIFRTTRSIDLTNFTGWNVSIVNGAIIGACAGKPVIDASGGRGYFFDNLFVWGDPTDRPSHGIIAPRATVNQFSGSQEFGRLTIDGYFTDAAFYAYGMEGAMLRHCMIWNRDFSGRVAIIEGYDEHPVTSDYATPLTGPTSMIWNKVLMTNFRHLPVVGSDPTMHTAGVPTAITKANPGVVTFSAAGHPFQNGNEVVFFQMAGMTQLNTLVATVANRTATTIELSGLDTSGFGTFTSGALIVKKSDHPPVYLSRVSQFDFDTSYIVAWGQPHIELGFHDSTRRKLTHVKLDLLYEGAGNPHNILFNTDGVNTCDLHGLIVTNYNANATDSFMSIEGGGTVRLWSSAIKVYDPTTTVDLFDLPASIRWFGVDIAYRTLAATGYTSVPGGANYARITDLTTGILYDVAVRSAHGGDNTSTSFSVTPGSGAFTTLGARTMTWRIDGEFVDIDMSIAITTNGTAAGYVEVALPVNAAADLDSVLTGRAVGGGNQLQAYLTAAGVMRIANYNNSYPGADGYTLVVSGRYRRA